MKLKIDELEKSFASNKVLKKASFVFEQGRIYALLGRNGSGKTTLFDLISEKKEKDFGSVYLIEDGSEKKLETSDLFYMVANPSFPNFLTAREFLKLFIDINKDRIKEDRSLDDLFDWIDFDLEERDHLIQGYSLGTKNKIQMLMFILLRPKVILMDEPLTSLDVVVQIQIKRLLKEIEKDHIIIFSTHILQLARDICDQIVILSSGKLFLLPEEKLKDGGFEDEIVKILSMDVKGEDNDLLKKIIQGDLDV
ncbi:MAG: ABC transporter ATP-binding protein [Tissierellia bacterium]|nr:ABC transporter ATP-binding protein [Tissierellia bacterium]